MLVLATFAVIGVFFVAFLLHFLFVLNAEIRLDKERSARTRQIAGNRIPLAAEVCKPPRDFTVVYANPQLAEQNIEVLTALLMRATSSGPTLALSGNPRSRREA